jgi:hypothetical protein
MISRLKELALAEALRVGTLSERQIAARIGVARGTVRDRKKREKREGEQGHHGGTEGTEGAQGADSKLPMRKDRCGLCGAKLTIVPCRRCTLLLKLGNEP